MGTPMFMFLVNVFDNSELTQTSERFPYKNEKTKEGSAITMGKIRQPISWFKDSSHLSVDKFSNTK